MSEDLQTISPDQVAVVNAMPPDAYVFIQAEGGPLQKVPYGLLLQKLIQTDLIFSAESALQADLAYDQDFVALVDNDPDPFKCGWWRKTGAIDEGEWVQFETLSKTISVGAAKNARLAAGFDAWADLETSAVLTDGDRTTVSASDIGTHDSVDGDYGASGGQTPNAGVYEKQPGNDLPVRVDDLDSTKAAAIVAAINLIISSYSALSGYLASFSDGNDNLLFGAKGDASFWTALSGNVDAAIAALKGASPTLISNSSGVLLGLVDSTDNDIFKVDKAGDLWTQGHNVTELMRSGGFPATPTAPLAPTSDISWYGDSLTENANRFAAALAEVITAAGETRNIHAEGLGGQTGPQILGRQQPYCTITFPLNADGFPEIPAQGTCAVTVSDGPLNHPGAGNGDTISRPYIVQWGEGVGGTLTRAAGGTDYTFTRAEPGAAIVLPAEVPIKPDNADRLKDIGICWLGTNGMNVETPEALYGYIDRYAQGQVTLSKECVIVMPTWDNSGPSRRATYDGILSYVKRDYPHCHIDLVALLQPLHDGSADDLADIAAGGIPRSLLKPDRLHLIDSGTTLAYDALARETWNVIKRNGW